MLNTMCVVAVTAFSGTTTPDKNGEMPVMLQGIAGTLPNRNVLSGTVAQRSGFEVGKTYLVNVREVGYDVTFGQDFSFVKVMELTSAYDVVRCARELGDAKLMVIGRPDGFEKNYERKGNAIESQRTIRTKEGLYKRAVPASDIAHATASDVLEGTSIESGGRIIKEGEAFKEPAPAPATQQ